MGGQTNTSGREGGRTDHRGCEKNYTEYLILKFTARVNFSACDLLTSTSYKYKFRGKERKDRKSCCWW